VADGETKLLSFATPIVGILLPDAETLDTGNTLVGDWVGALTHFVGPSVTWDGVDEDSQNISGLLSGYTRFKNRKNSGSKAA